VLDRPRATHVLVAAEHHQGREAVLHDLIGVAEAEVDRVLGGEERHHALTRHVGAQVGDQVAQVVLLLRAHGAVGDHHAHVVAHQAPDGVIRVDPGVDASRGLEFGARRTQFDGDDVRRSLQGGEDYWRSFTEGSV
jgi:hypothetical protein